MRYLDLAILFANSYTQLYQEYLILYRLLEKEEEDDLRDQFCYQDKEAREDVF